MVLAGQLRTPVVELPADHGGFLAQPEEFSHIPDTGAHPDDVTLKIYFSVQPVVRARLARYPANRSERPIHRRLAEASAHRFGAKVPDRRGLGSCPGAAGTYSERARFSRLP